MTRARIALAGTVAAIAATVLLLGGAFAETRPEAAPAASVVDDPFAGRAARGFEGGDAADAVRRLQARVRSDPDDVGALGRLGFAYQQRARETGDSSYLPRAEGVLQSALRLAPDDAQATSGLAALALTRHRFREALTLGRRALALAPRDPRNVGIVGDALVELGRHREAFAAFDRMIRLEPDLPAYARIAYARELLGRPSAAVRPARAAVDASRFEREPFAWASVQLGKLFWSMGRVEAAAREYRAALAIFPGYVYALDGLAHAEAAEGRFGNAVRLARRAVDAVPMPQFAATLGDILLRIGRRADAREQYALVQAVDRVQVANGVRTDLELAAFNVDRGMRLRDSLAAVRRAWRERPSLDADDTLAWALARNGRCAEALRFSERSLRLGTRDAVKYFHRGMIERCLDRPAVARSWFRRALAQNRHFSLLWSAVARRYAR